MLFAIDVGNTNITLFVVHDGKMIKEHRLATTKKRTSGEYGKVFLEILDMLCILPQDVQGMIISSVVPYVTPLLEQACRQYLLVDPIVVKNEMITEITIKTEEPHLVGVDRIVDAIGAYLQYGGPILVVDFGTATTFDYINEKGEFLYGVTAPGLEICSNALSSCAAQLPDIELEKPNSILATNTITSMQAGVVYGYIGLSEYIIKQMKEEIGENIRVIATGGLGRIIAREIDTIDFYDENLTLIGLLEIYKKHANGNISY